MPISYDKLWKILFDRQTNHTKLEESASVIFKVFARIGQRNPISLKSFFRICSCLQCNIGVMEFANNE